MDSKSDDYRLGWITGRTEMYAEWMVMQKFHELIRSTPWQSAENCWLEAMRVYGQPMLRDFDAKTDAQKLEYESDPYLRTWINNIRGDNLLDLPRYLR